MHRTLPAAAPFSPPPINTDFCGGADPSPAGATMQPSKRLRIEVAMHPQQQPRRTPDPPTPQAPTAAPSSLLPSPTAAGFGLGMESSSPAGTAGAARGMATQALPGVPAAAGSHLQLPRTPTTGSPPLLAAAAAAVTGAGRPRRGAPAPAPGSIPAAAAATAASGPLTRQRSSGNIGGGGSPAAIQQQQHQQQQHQPTPAFTPSASPLLLMPTPVGPATAAGAQGAAAVAGFGSSGCGVSSTAAGSGAGSGAAPGPSPRSPLAAPRDGRSSGLSPQQKVDRILERYGQSFCEELQIPLLERPSEGLWQWLCASILFSARIKSNAAVSACKALFSQGLVSPEAVKRVSKEDCRRLLHDSGYERYDEKTASFLVDDARLVLSEYEGDLSNLRDAAGKNPLQARALLKKLKGVGDGGVDIFFREVQLVWHELFPFADKKALKAARLVGLREHPQSLADLCGGDKHKYVCLISALVRIELGKCYGEF